MKMGRLRNFRLQANFIAAKAYAIVLVTARYQEKHANLGLANLT